MRAQKTIWFALGCWLALIAGQGAAWAQTGARTPASRAGMQDDPLAPCGFLLGDWVGVEGSGQPGEAVSGGTTFTRDLSDKVIVRKNFANYAPKPGEKTGISHQDLMIIYQTLGETQLKAFYVDNEGHEINYRLAFPKNWLAVFESEASQKAPRFRLEYELNPDKTMTVTFSFAPPGGTYQVYTKGSVRRK